MCPQKLSVTPIYQTIIVTGDDAYSLDDHVASIGEAAVVTSNPLVSLWGLLFIIATAVSSIKAKEWAPVIDNIKSTVGKTPIVGMAVAFHLLSKITPSQSIVCSTIM